MSSSRRTTSPRSQAARSAASSYYSRRTRASPETLRYLQMAEDLNKAAHEFMNTVAKKLTSIRASSRTSPNTKRLEKRLTKQLERLMEDVEDYTHNISNLEEEIEVPKSSRKAETKFFSARDKRARDRDFEDLLEDEEEYVTNTSATRGAGSARRSASPKRSSKGSR